MLAAMSHHSLAGALRRWIFVPALMMGCFSRWSGCRSYDTGHVSGPNWSARVQCDPHTEFSAWGQSRGVVPTPRGCSAKWSFIVEREHYPESFPLRAPDHRSNDCGEVRRVCSTSHGELAQRATTLGTWVAARAPGGSTRVAFVPSACGIAYGLPDDGASTATPAGAVEKQPDGAAFIDGVIAHAPITETSWYLVCGPVLAQRKAAVREAALQCRTPDVVANELFRVDPESVDAVWLAFAEDRLPCGILLHADLRASAHDQLARAVVRLLTECGGRCSSRARVTSLREAGELRVPESREITQRIAAAGPPARVSRDAPPAERARYEAAYDEWLSAHWALGRVDARAGNDIAIATLRRLPPPESPAHPLRRSDEYPTADYDDPMTTLCELLLNRDSSQTRDALWQLALDASLNVGLRQRALLSLARLGDARGTGAGLPDNPLTAEQAGWAASEIAEAHPSPGSSASGGSSGHHHSHHHWH